MSSASRARFSAAVLRNTSRATESRASVHPGYSGSRSQSGYLARTDAKLLRSPTAHTVESRCRAGAGGNAVPSRRGPTTTSRYPNGLACPLKCVETAVIPGESFSVRQRADRARTNSVSSEIIKIWPEVIAFLLVSHFLFGAVLLLPPGREDVLRLCPGLPHCLSSLCA